jgi:vacuolar-type H+-ATPase subunit E/Vma4
VAIANQNSPALLCEEILADARRESEQIVRRAREEADAMLAKATAEADNARFEHLEKARTEVARRIELILATVPVEAGRLRSASVEALLQSVRAEVHRRLLARDGFDYRETILALAAEAVSRIAGDAFVVKLAAADRAALGDGLAGEIARRVGRSPSSITLADEPVIAADGVIVQDAEGRQMWDNRLAVRLERLWPELRRQIAVQIGLITTSESTGGRA